MTILGFSDAKLSVVKRGPEEVLAQGLLADHIGPKVCPQVLRFLPDGYEMELLEPPPYRNVTTLVHAWEILRREVWPRNSYKGWNEGWLEPLKKWAEAVPHLLEPINRVYPVEPADGYCLIHGDPTLANVMLRRDDMIITDPMPRLEYRKEIPNRREVDLGKLFQSACGWERMLGCESSLWDQGHQVLNFVESEHRAKVMLWGAIHLARVGMRAPGRGKTRIASWAINESCIWARHVLVETR